MASAFEIFTRAENIELAAASLYQLLRERFPWSDEDRALFQRLEEEEVQHAARIRLLAAHYRNDAKLFTVGPEAMAQLEDIERRTREVIDEIAAARWDEDLPGLKERLADLEEHSGGSHADLLAEVADLRLAEFFRELSRQDHEHRDLLLAALRRDDGGGPKPPAESARRAWRS